MAHRTDFKSHKFFLMKKMTSFRGILGHPLLTSVLLDVQANLPETSPFFVWHNGFGEHLFSNVYSTWDV